MINLRPYQLKGADSTEKVWERCRSALRVGATGTGKTVEIVEMVRRAREQGHRSLVVVDATELVEQTVDKIKSILHFTPDIEKADARAILNPDFAAPCVVATIQTLRYLDEAGVMRCQRFPADFFGRIFADEAHLTITPTTMDVFAYFMDPDKNPNGRLCGYTATPERGDGASLGQLYDEVALRYDIIDAIVDGYLVPVHGKVVRVENVEISKIQHHDGDDFTNDQVSELMSSQGAIVEQAAGLARVCDGTTIVFCPDVRHAELLAARLNDHTPGSADVVSGKTPKAERKETIRRFRAGELKYLCNCMVLTKGFDCDEIRYVAICRFTKSWSLFCLDEETQILTRRGWVGIDRISESDQAAQINTQDDSMSWSPIRGIVRRGVYEDEMMVGYESPSQSWRVTDSHRMVYRKRQGRSRVRTPWMISTAGEMIKERDSIEVPVSGFERATGVNLTDDELRFIGWVMTDGTINKHTNGIAITQDVNQPWCSDIDKCLKGCGFKYTKRRVVRKTQFSDHSEIFIWTISKGKPRGTKTHLRGWGDLEPYLSKDLSPKLESINRDQLGVLLHAIHLGDGAKQSSESWTRQSYHITTGNITFADRLQSLCVRRGWACNISVGKWNANPVYVLHIKDIQVRTIGTTRSDRPRPALSRPRSNERVWCVETDRSTLVTRRHGKVTIMGNCQMVGRGTRPIDGILNGLGTAQSRRDAIAASDKPHMTVLSFVGREGPVNLMGPTDALAGDMEPREVSVRAQELMEEQDDLDAIDALEQARDEIEQEKKRRLDTASVLFSGGDVEVEETDLFDKAAFSVAIRDKLDVPPRHQLAFLNHYGFSKKEVAAWSGERVQSVIRWAMDRHERGLCTKKQARQLKRHYPSMSKEERLNMTKGDAGKLLGQAATGGGYR